MAAIYPAPSTRDRCVTHVTLAPSEEVVPAEAIWVMGMLGHSPREKKVIPERFERSGEPAGVPR